MIKTHRVPLALVFASVLTAWLPKAAFAFPELVRHGYVNCTSCHVSPTGGGVLTPYGRQLSADVLSTWSTEREPGFLEGYVAPPAWLNVGGDLRAVEIYRDMPQVRAFRLLNMQEDVEAAATWNRFTADLAAGLYMSNPPLRRFFLQYRPNDELSLRFGKYRLAYGLMDHAHPSRRGWASTSTLMSPAISGSGAMTSSRTP